MDPWRALVSTLEFTPPVAVCRYYKTDIRGAADGRLAGRSVAVKDSIAVAGVPMMNGSRILEGFIPDIDATVVTRVLDAGD